MKPLKYLLTAIMVLFFVTAHAQRPPSGDETPAKLKTILSSDSKKDWHRFADGITVDATRPSNFFSQHREAFDLQDGTEMLLTSRSEEKNLGMNHYRFQQTFRGIPIVGAEYILHQRGSRPLKGNGHVVGGFSKADRATITADEALQAVLRQVNAKKYAWEDAEMEQLIRKQKGDRATLRPEPRLVYYASPSADRDAPSSYRLAYEMKVFALEPLSQRQFYVSAETGEVINSINLLHDVNTPATGNAIYNGNQSFTTDFNGTNYVLREANRLGTGTAITTLDMNNGTNFSMAVDFQNNTTDWQNEPVGVQGHWGLEKAFDYYFLVHGRNSYDNAGGAITAYLEYGVNLNNASWSNVTHTMLFGGGDNVTRTAWTSVDIVAHELTHGVTELSAGLVYQNESGALNESFSDIFGAAVEFYVEGTAGDWLVSEDVTINGSGIRSMSNPNIHSDPDTYHGTFWQFTAGDNGGVHTNSGVQNHWFYLLSDGGSGTNDLGNSFSLTGVGKEVAAAIAYRNLTQYLTPLSGYADAREGALMAAEDLYDRTSNEYAQTAMAWYAVGIGYPVYATEDLAVKEVTLTGTSCNELSVELINLSTAATIPAGAVIDIVVSENGVPRPAQQVILAASMAPGNSVIVQMTQGVLSTAGRVNLQATITYPPDPEAGNNLATSTVYRGTLTIGGASPDFPSIEAAVAAVNAPNITICGHLVFKLRSGLYNGEVRISGVSVTSPQQTITFESESGNPADVTLYSFITFNSAFGGVTIENSNHVGLRNLTIVREQAPGVLTSSGLSLRGPVENILIEGNVFRNPGAGTSRRILQFWAFGARQKDITIRGNSFSEANEAIAQGNAETALIDNVIIEDNTFNGLVDVMRLSIGGKHTVRRNVAISAIANLQCFTIGGSEVLVEENDLRLTGTSPNGFSILDRVNGTARVVNNMISIKASGTNANGIQMGNMMLAEVLHNTIRIEKTTTGNGTSTTLGFSAGATQRIVLNNILYNTIAGNAFGISLGSGTNEINHNDFYIPNGITGRFNNVNSATLAQWQATTGNDMNSVAMQPMFVSDVDLRLAAQQPGLRAGKLVNVPKDIDGEQRGFPRYIGADEYFFNSDLGVSAIRPVGPGVLCQEAHIEIDVRNYSPVDIFSSGIQIPVTLTVNNGAPVSETVTLTANLLPGQHVTYAFANTFSFQEGDLISARTVYPGDQDPLNDTTTIAADFNNIFTVGGINPDFTTIQAAVNFVSAGVPNLLCDRVILRMRPGTYQQPLTINEIPGIRLILESETGNADDVVISSNTVSTVILPGAKRVTFKEVTLRYSGSSATEAIVMVRNICADIAFTNCKFLSPVLAAEHYAIKAGPTLGPQLNGLQISHCVFTNGGIKMESNANVSYPFDNVRIDSSEFVNSHTHAILLNRTGTVTVSDNVISSANTSSGISIHTPQKDVRVERNKVTLDAGVNGIFFYNLLPSFSKIFVFNNFVNLRSGASAVTGLTVEGKGGYVYHNTIKLSNGPVAASTAIALQTRNNGAAIRNNILYAGIANAIGIDWYNAGVSQDYNDIYVPSGFIGRSDTQTFSTLAAWQAALNVDLRSVVVEPIFVSATDLHLATYQPELRGGNAFLFPFVYTDIDGDQRSMPLYMGADEFIRPPYADLFPNSIANVPVFGQSYIVDVVSNSEWTIVTPVPAGIQIDTVASDGFMITVSPNPLAVSRSFTINVQTVDTPVGTSSLQIFQEGPPAITANPGITSIDLSWQPATGAATYKIWLSLDGLPTDSLLASVGAGVTSFSHSGLSTGVEYTYQLSVEDAIGNESAKSPAVTAILADPFVEVSPAEILEASLFSAGYEINVSSNSPWVVTTPTPPGVTVTNVTANSFSVILDTNPLGVDREFDLSVQTTAAPLASSVLHIVQDGPPLMTAQPGNGKITLSWQPLNGTKVYQYKIYRYAKTGPLLLVTLPATQTTYINTGLTNGVTYRYQLSVVDRAGNESALSPVVAATPGFFLPFSVNNTVSAANESDKLMAYPNPTEGNLSLHGQVKSTGAYTALIINSYGWPMKKQEINLEAGEIRSSVHTETLSPGIYLLRLTDPSGQVVSTIRFEKK
jgi:Zn-dependent metalloprotease